VKVCSRAANGYADHRPRVIWDAKAQSQDFFSVEDTIDWSLPMDYMLATDGSLGYTNASLPHGIQPFTAHEYVQCLGVILAKCLVPGPIRKMWSDKDNGILPAVSLGKRFGISRDRFLDWVRYLRFCPPGTDYTDAERIKPFIDAWNAHRNASFSPGTGLIVDESISKFKPFFEQNPNGIQWLVKILRKPVGVGSELKNTACADSGTMLFIELQEGSAAMESKEFCDK
jgi:hypothetical protein